MPFEFTIPKYVPASSMKTLKNKYTIRYPPGKLWDYTSVAVLYVSPDTVNLIIRVMVSPADLFSLQENIHIDVTIYPLDDCADHNTCLAPLIQKICLDKHNFDYLCKQCPCKQTQQILTPFPVFAEDLEFYIPKCIVQTSCSALTNYKMFSACMSLVDQNPDFEYIFMDDHDIDLFVKENFPDNVYNIFQAVLPGAYKADLFRYMYLYKKGGFYFDCKMIAKVPISHMIDPKDKLVLCKDRPFQALYNAVLFAAPESPLLAAAIAESVRRLSNFMDAQDKKSENMCLCKYGVYGFTGPKLLWDVANRGDGSSAVTKLIFSNLTGQIHHRIKTNRIYTTNPMHWIRERHDLKMLLIPWYPDYYADQSRMNPGKSYKQLFLDGVILRKVGRLKVM